MTCPHCHATLTVAQAKSIWASYSASKRRRAGRHVSCECGVCRKCKQRDGMRKKRAGVKKKA